VDQWPHTSVTIYEVVSSIPGSHHCNLQDLVLRTPGIYRIPCECGKVCIAHTGLSVDARLKAHQQHIQLEHPDKSAISERSVNLGHCI
jgi:hypothetical protein